MNPILDDIRNVKANFSSKFTEYDQDLKTLQDKYDSSRSSFEHWFNKSLAQIQNNDVRLFSLETKLKHEDSQRYNESQGLKGVVLKLIYTIEQFNLKIFHNKLKDYDQREQEEDFLPKIGPSQSFSLAYMQKENAPPMRKADNSEITDSDLIFLKRLHYLRKILEEGSHLVQPPRSVETNSRLLKYDK